MDQKIKYLFILLHGFKIQQTFYFDKEHRLW